MSLISASVGVVYYNYISFSFPCKSYTVHDFTMPLLYLIDIFLVFYSTNGYPEHVLRRCFCCMLANAFHAVPYSLCISCTCTY